MRDVFGIYFWVALMTSIVFGGFAQARCDDCGMPSDHTYGGR